MQYTIIIYSILFTVPYSSGIFWVLVEGKQDLLSSAMNTQSRMTEKAGFQIGAPNVIYRVPPQSRHIKQKNDRCITTASGFDDDLPP